jgi:hypothetical protein
MVRNDRPGYFFQRCAPETWAPPVRAAGTMRGPCGTIGARGTETAGGRTGLGTTVRGATGRGTTAVPGFSAGRTAGIGE